MKLVVFGLLFVLVVISLSSPVPKAKDDSRRFGVLRKIFGLGSESLQGEGREGKVVVPRSRQSRKSLYQGGRRRFIKCRPGNIPNVAGECTEPIVERRVYVYNSPSNIAREQYENIEAQTKPRIDYHLVLINKNEGDLGGAEGLGSNLIMNEEEFRNSIQNFGKTFELNTNADLPFNAANHRELLNLINEAQQSQGFQSEGSGLLNRGRNLQRYVVVEQSNPRLDDIKQLIREVNRKSQLRALKERQELAARLSQNAKANIIEERRKSKKFQLDRGNSHPQLLGTSHLPLAFRTSLGNRLRLGSHLASQAVSGFGRGSSGSHLKIKSQSHSGGGGRSEGSDSTGGDDSEAVTGSGRSSGKEGSEQDAEASLGSEGSEQNGNSASGDDGSETSSRSEASGQVSTSSGNDESGQDGESSSRKEQGSGSSSGSEQESETNAESGGSESEGEQSGSGTSTGESESVAQSEADDGASNSNFEQTEGESSGDQSGAQSTGDQSKGDDMQTGFDGAGSDDTGSGGAGSDGTGSGGTDSEGEKAEMEGSQSATDDSGSNTDTEQSQTEGSEGEQSETENAQSEHGSSSKSITSGLGDSESSGNDESQTGEENPQQQSEASSSSDTATSESGGSGGGSDQETSQNDSISESENDIEARSQDSELLNRESNLYSLSNRRQVIGNESYIKINIASIKDFPLVFVRLNPENENYGTVKQYRNKK